MAHDPSNDRRRDHQCRCMLATTSEACLVLDPSGVIRIMNEAAEGLFGRARSESVSQPVEALGDADLAERVRAELAEAPAHETRAFEVVGPDRLLSCRLAPYLQDGEERVMLAIRSEGGLLRERRRMEDILSSTEDGLLVFSADDHITYASPAACEMLGYSTKDLVGRHTCTDELLGLDVGSDEEPLLCWQHRDCTRTDCAAHGGDDPRCWLRSGTLTLDGHPASFREKQRVCATCDVFRTNRDLVAESGTPARREVSLREGEDRIASVKTNPVVDSNGDYAGTVTWLSDVTAEREVAEMKTEFVSTVSHELRTPLTSIKGYVDLVLDGEAGELGETQLEYLGIVKENSDRLVKLINDLLDISRIESGRVHLKIEPVDLSDVVADVVGTLRAVLDQGHVDLKIDLPDDLPPVAADEHRVGQVITNLVSNAIKYSPGGGTVRVTGKVGAGEVILSVSDTGIGISEEDQKRLFAKFFRVDSSHAREIGGTGLGLSICRSIIELLGGSIDVESEIGVGSTFSFALPVAPSGLVRTPEVAGPVEVEGGTVLVVDGEEHIAGLIETYLTSRGYDVVQAATGREALELARRVEPNAITLDVMLEDMDGFELLQRLKKDPATSSIPVVVLSVVCDEGKSCRLGAANYLEKPIHRDSLVATIDDVIGSMEAPLALVVDDDERVVESLSEPLRDHGFAVAVAYNGEEAMAAIETQTPDLILLDLEMPVMDGYEVMRRVKTGPSEWRDIPIVVMTAHELDEGEFDVLGHAAGQVAKPFQADPVAERIESLLTRDA